MRFSIAIPVFGQAQFLPSALESLREFVRTHVKKAEGRDVTGAELCAAYAQVAASKGWAIVSLARAQKILPYAMVEVHGITRSHNITRPGTASRGYRNVCVTL